MCKYGQMQIVILSPDKELDRFIYGTLFCVTAYRNYEPFFTNSPLFGPPCIIIIFIQLNNSQSITTSISFKDGQKDIIITTITRLCVSV